MAGETEGTVVDGQVAANAVETDEDNDEDFASGYSGQAEEVTEKRTKEPTTTPAPAAAPAPVAAAPASAPAASPAPAKPKYVKVTEEDWMALRNVASLYQSEREGLRKGFDTVNGRMGHLKQMIDAAQAATQAGKPVELSAEDVAELKEAYGEELSAPMLKVLQRIAGKMHGTMRTAPAAPAGPAYDPAVVSQQMQQHLLATVPALREQLKQEMAAEALAEEFPNWREIAGAPGSQTPFRQWMAKQPAEYAERVFASNNATVIANAIRKFQEATKPQGKPAATAPKQESRFAAAVAPKGGAPAAVPEAEDDFAAGFKGQSRKSY